jgi:hypothetical protein
MRAWGSRYARLVYERCGHNRRDTCRLLEISYHTLRAYLSYAQRKRHRIPGRMPAWARCVRDSSGEAEEVEQAGG